MYYAFDLTNHKALERTRSAFINDVEHLARIMSRSTEDYNSLTIAVLDEDNATQCFFRDGVKYAPVVEE